MRILRTLDNDHYQVKLQWKDAADLAETEKHRFVLSPKSGNTLEFSCLFSPEEKKEALPTFAETESNNLEIHWWHTAHFANRNHPQYL